MKVRLNRVTKTFRSGKVTVRALTDIDLSIDEGTFTCIHGPSGSGKTTLLNIIGLLDRPSAGSLVFGGKDFAAASEATRTRIRRASIGAIFQDYSLIPNLTVYENVMYPLMFGDEAFRARRERVAGLLDSIGLAALRHRMPGQLSGGEKQRAAVASALAIRPSLIVADEPTANLDSHSADILIGLLKEITVTRKISCVIASHDERVRANADLLFELVDGRLCR